MFSSQELDMKNKVIVPVGRNDRPFKDCPFLPAGLEGISSALPDVGRRLPIADLCSYFDVCHAWTFRTFWRTRKCVDVDVWLAWTCQAFATIVL